MIDVNRNPTLQVYGWLEAVAQHFNAALFGGELPAVVFTLQRRNASSGHFISSRWRSKVGEDDPVSEIAINPAVIASRSLISLYQAITHELCHHWQDKKGHVTRDGYHNSEWAEKMIEIGLMPSSTGAPGGKKTGQKMADYPIVDGKFIKACVSIVDDLAEPPLVETALEHPLFNRRMALNEYQLSDDLARKLNLSLCTVYPGLQFDESAEALAKAKLKVKYNCGSCNDVAVWGRSGLDLNCNICKIALTEVAPKQPYALASSGRTSLVRGDETRHENKHP